MAKGQMRSSKEKKKPKQDKEKRKGTSAYAQAYHAQPGSSPLGIKKQQLSSNSGAAERPPRLRIKQRACA
jgi:hypothetical protein